MKNKKNITSILKVFLADSAFNFLLVPVLWVLGLLFVWWIVSVGINSGIIFGD